MKEDLAEHQEEIEKARYEDLGKVNERALLMFSQAVMADQEMPSARTPELR